MAINVVEDIIPVTKVREQIGSVIEHARETKRPIIRHAEWERGGRHY